MVDSVIVHSAIISVIIASIYFVVLIKITPKDIKIQIPYLTNLIIALVFFAFIIFGHFMNYYSWTNNILEFNGKHLIFDAALGIGATLIYYSYLDIVYEKENTQLKKHMTLYTIMIPYIIAVLSIALYVICFYSLDLVLFILSRFLKSMDLNLFALYAFLLLLVAFGMLFSTFKDLFFRKG